jgi:glycosyltransferase involved in cell wall biosynthesis
MPKVSAVIPLYNKEKYITRAIDSVLAQTVQDFEIIVVDDGSTDGGVNVVRQYRDERIRLIQQSNAGVSAARNLGIEESTADLIAFLDADDAWKPEFLETVLRLRNKYPTAGIYATSYEIKQPNGRVIRPRYRAIPPFPWEGVIPNYFESASALDSLPVNSSAVMIPKRVFKTCGGFPLGEKQAEDLDMWLRIAVEYPVAFSCVVASRYHCDAEDQTTKREKALETFAIEKTIQNILSNRNLSSSDRKFLKEIIYGLKLVRASYRMKAGLFEQARNILYDCPTHLLWKKKFWFYFLLALPPKIVLKAYRLFRYWSGAKT